MKRKFFGLLATLALLALPTLAGAHEYDRDDSDHPLRYAAYVIHPIGIAVEYTLLRPIHWLVSRPTACVWFGHEPRPEEDKDYMRWE